MGKMIRVAILDDYFNKSLDLADWSVLQGRVELEVFCRYLGSDEDELAVALADFDIIVGMRERTPFPASLIQRLPQLKLLITTGMRNASFDLAAATAQGVVVCGTGGIGDATAELTIGMMIALSRDIPGQLLSMRQGGWQTRPGSILTGKTLGLLGLGRLGQSVARIAQAMGMKVIAWSQNLTDELAQQHQVLRVSKEQLFRNADVISIHLVLSKRTRGLVGAEELSWMKPSAYLINTSRGPIVDEQALISALQQKAIAGAALDVYSTEPLPADHPFRSLDNLLPLPHIGYVTTENFAAMYQQVVEDIQAYLDGDPIRVLNQG